MKQGRLIVHTISYNATMGSEAKKTHCSHNELQCKQWVMKKDLHKDLHQGVTMQTMGNEAKKTHCSHKELQCKQRV
ncbi:hypothetical protein KSS87_003263, partial [Heliosperma pusillum]